MLGGSEKKVTYKRDQINRSWITIIECISAAQKALLPLVIFPGKSVQQQWFPQNNNDLDLLKPWFFTSQENGWTSDEIALYWLHHIFIPLTKPLTNEKRLLIIDGHGSHTTDDFLFSCYENDIYVLFLPSHTSHVLQPLDISIFSSLKSTYRADLYQASCMDTVSPIGKAAFLLRYYKARQIALTPRNIRSGWSGAGLWPINMAKPLLSPLIIKPITPSKIINTSPKHPRDPVESAIYTPQSGKELSTILKGIPLLNQRDPLIRRLFTKVRKGLDKYTLETTDKSHRIRQLEQQISKAHPIKRRKVEGDLNSRFISVQDVIRVRATLGPDRSEKRSPKRPKLGPMERHLFEFQANVNCM